MSRIASRHNIWLAAVAVLFLAVGCGKDDPVTPPPPTPLPGDQAAPDFTLADTNPNSASHNQAISPRQKLGKISAWYFGHST